MKLDRILLGHESEVRSIGFSHDGKYLASGSGDKDLFLWDMETYQITGKASTMGEIDGINWYPNQNSFITADGTGAIIRWDVEDMGSMLAPFQKLLAEIEAANDPNRREEFVQKFDEVCAQYDSATLQTKNMFYVVWQCKRALGLLKSNVKK